MKDNIKKTVIELPDSIRPYLNEIAERVWAERAAVMVGWLFRSNHATHFGAKYATLHG